MSQSFVRRELAQELKDISVAYVDTASADAPPPATPNPFSVNLYQNIERLKLDVRQIAALHGPRLVALADLRNAIGQSARPTN